MRTSIEGMAMVMALFAGGVLGCASGPQARGAAEGNSGQSRTTDNRGVVTTSDPNSVPPEKLEEIDMFFKHKAAHLQYECYNPEVDRTHKKYEGNVSVSLVVLPGGKASEVKLIGSTLRSTDPQKVSAPGIENCVLQNVKEWEWPDVASPAPYMGSINFKPAW